MFSGDSAATIQRHLDRLLPKNWCDMHLFLFDETLAAPQLTVSRAEAASIHFLTTGDLPENTHRSVPVDHIVLVKHLEQTLCLAADSTSPCWGLIPPMKVNPNNSISRCWGFWVYQWLSHASGLLYFCVAPQKVNRFWGVTTR